MCQSKVNFKKKSRSFLWEISISCIIRNAIILQHLIIQFLLYYRWSGCLQEVEIKENFQRLALVNKRWLQLLVRGGRLQEVPNTCKVIWIGNLFIILENWSTWFHHETLVTYMYLLSSVLYNFDSYIYSVFDFFYGMYRVIWNAYWFSEVVRNTQTDRLLVLFIIINRTILFQSYSFWSLFFDIFKKDKKWG